MQAILKSAHPLCSVIKQSIFAFSLTRLEVRYYSIVRWLYFDSSYFKFYRFQAHIYFFVFFLLLFKLNFMWTSRTLCMFSMNLNDLSKLDIQTCSSFLCLVFFFSNFYLSASTPTKVIRILVFFSSSFLKFFISWKKQANA